jgi:hypothetical protein
MASDLDAVEGEGAFGDVFGGIGQVSGKVERENRLSHAARDRASLYAAATPSDNRGFGLGFSESVASTRSRCSLIERIQLRERRFGW